LRSRFLRFVNDGRQDPGAAVVNICRMDEPGKALERWDAH
jgi:hypothetical protein